MGTVGRENIGEWKPEMLLIDTKRAAEVCHVIIAEGQGKLKRGTVLAADTEGKCNILGTDGCTAAYILAKDADDSTESDVVAQAYRSGDFNKGALIVKENYTISNKDITDLRNGGIYLGNIM